MTTLSYTVVGNGDKTNVLFIHGWRSSKSSPLRYARRLADSGARCMVFDLGGMGETDGDAGSITRREYVSQCVLAYDLFSDAIGNDEVAVVGSSFGAYLACLLTLERRVEQLVLRVPANYPDDGIDLPQSLYSDAMDDGTGWRLRWRDFSRSLPLDALSKYEGAVLVLQSENDEIVDSEMVGEFVEMVGSSRVAHVVMDAPHKLVEERHQREYGDILIKWLTGSKLGPQPL